MSTVISTMRGSPTDAFPVGSSKNGKELCVGADVARATLRWSKLTSVSDLAKRRTCTLDVFATRSTCTSSIATLSCVAMLLRKNSLAFWICAALGFRGRSSSVPEIWIGRGIICTQTPETLMYPETHQQSVARSVAGKEDVSAGQDTHPSGPVMFLYRPAEQATQVKPPGPMYPGSHTQSVIKPEIPSVCECTGHKLQFALPSGDHCPAGQYLHVSGLIAL
jgi:hypothetical protein